MIQFGESSEIKKNLPTEDTSTDARLSVSSLKTCAEVCVKILFNNISLNLNINDTNWPQVYGFVATS